MFEAYLLYLSIALLVPFLFRKIIRDNAQLSRKQVVKIGTILLIISIFIGGRYYVGTDWQEYLWCYRNSLNNQSLSASLNYGFDRTYGLFNYIVARLGFSISGFFTIVAFLMFALMLGGEKKRAYLFPWIIMCFVGFRFFFNSMNIIRQMLGISFFLYAVPNYIGEKRIRLLIYIWLSILFHHGNIALLMALFIDKKCFEFLDNSNTVLVLYIIVFLGQNIFVSIFVHLIPFEFLSDNNQYSMSDLEAISSGRSEVMRIGQACVDIFCILYSQRVKSFFGNDTKMRYTYRLWFFGIILYNIMGTSILLSRIPKGFQVLSVYIMSYTIYCLVKTSKGYDRLIVTLFYVSTILIIIYEVANHHINCSPYVFKWL